MPRPRTKEEGGEAQWGKEEPDKGAPVEQRGESLLDGGSEVSRSRHGFKAQSQVYELPAICSEAIDGSREGEGKVGALCRRSRCCKDGNGSEVHDESRGEWERERKESFSRVGVCTYVRNGLCDNNNFFNIGSTAMLFTFGIWL